MSKAFPPDIVETKYWHQLEDGRIQCDLCPRFCRLREGQRGLCFVRANQNNQIVLTTYGRASGYCIDPVEKKPLNHFLPGTPILSFGTAGCNLACKFCQNWDISKSRDQDRLTDHAPPELIAHAAQRMKCSSIAFTYNDPVIFHEYAIDVAQACHAIGIRSVAVSAGYVCPSPRAEFYRYMDAANIDLKAFTERFYKKITGSSLSSVLDTLQYLKHETHVWFEITNLLIPGENDSNQEIEAMCAWINDHLGPYVPVHFSAFHPDWKMLNKEHTPAETLLRAREIALKQGLAYVYVGNVHHEPGSSTYCHGCNEKIIGRDWYLITKYHLNEFGDCNYCGTHCHGLFDGPVGQWGRKRMPIQLSNFET